LLLLAAACNHGFARTTKGTVDQQTLCTPTGDGCPVCSSRDGAQCRDQWYPAAVHCTALSSCAAPATCQSGYCVTHDEDGDGLDDDFEREIAEVNFPTVWLAQGEPCGTPHGVIYRVRRHPQNPQLIAVTYIVLYGVDCGEATGHLGDAESFAITVDLDAQPGAPATVGIAAFAHAGTTCGSTSSCTAQMATSACAYSDSSAASTPGGGAASAPGEMTIFSSTNKHANYLSLSTCSDNCFDRCSMGERITGPLLNVGEPDHPLVTDLTTQGFVAGPGWDASLMHINPWGKTEFGGGGRLDVPLESHLAPPGQ
jgi:hypothetical protein